MSEHLKLDFLLIEHIAESESILLGVTLNPAISLVNHYTYEQSWIIGSTRRV